MTNGCLSQPRSSLTLETEEKPSFAKTAFFVRKKGAQKLTLYIT